MKLYRLRDKRAEGYLDVFQTPNAGTAMRWCKDKIREGQIPPSWCEDLALYEVGEEDPHTGLVVGHEVTKQIIDLVELLEEAPT